MKKNKYSTPLWMLATILAGMLSPMQSAVNGQLGHWLQDGNACAVISFASGLVVMFFIIMARKETRQQFAAIPSLIKNRKVPLWNWFAGLCGAMVVFSEGASASALGVATFQTALISALLLSGLLCDRFGELWYRCRREKILYPLSHHRCIICGYCYTFLLLLLRWERGQKVGSVLIDVLIPSLGNTVYLVTIIGTLFALVGAIVTTIPEYRTSKTMKKMEV